MIGGALVGTFLGVFLAYGFVGPFANRVKAVIDEDQHFYNLIREVMVAALHNHAPNICVEVGRQNTPAEPAPLLQRARRRAAGLEAEPRGMIRAGVLGAWRRWPPRRRSRAEGGAIRGGEHAGFSRIVLTIEPTTEWSLETAPGRATIFFPGKRLAFGTERHLREAAAQTASARCGPSAGDARHHASRSRSAATAASAPPSSAPATSRSTWPTATSCPRRRRPSQRGRPRRRGRPRTRRPRQRARPRPSPRPRQILIRADRARREPGPDRAVAPARPHAGAGRGAGRRPSRSRGSPLRPRRPRRRRRRRRRPRLPLRARARPRPAHGSLAALLDHEQIEATTVFDRDSRRADRAAAASPVPPAECLPDDALDVGAWSNGLPLHRAGGRAAPPQPRRRVRRARTRRRCATSPGSTSASASAPRRRACSPSFDAAARGRALLVDLARAVEGRPGGAGRAARDRRPPAPGATASGSRSAASPRSSTTPAHFATVQAAFAELPTDLRALLGPALIGRLLDAGHAGEARLIYDTTVRPGLATAGRAAARRGAARRRSRATRPRRCGRSTALVEDERATTPSRR